MDKATEVGRESDLPSWLVVSMILHFIPSTNVKLYKGYKPGNNI